MVDDRDIEILLEDYWISVPEILHSVQHEGPFDSCIVCQCNLLEENCLYIIEKVFKGDRVICEYSICSQCRKQLTEDWSLESVAKIIQYWEEKTNMIDRQLKLLAKSKTSIEPWIEYCMFTGTPRHELETYSIIAKCQGPNMHFSWMPWPCMIGEPAIEEIMKLLSKKTKDAIDDFTETYLGLGPEFADVPNDFSMLI